MGYTMGYIFQKLWDIFVKSYGIYLPILRGILWDIIGNIFKLLDILSNNRGIF